MGLSELQREFMEQFEMQVGTAVEGGLNKKAKSMLREICIKYDNPQNADKILSVQSKVSESASDIGGHVWMAF